MAEFVKAAWHVVEPGGPNGEDTLVWNWHLDALCLHLEAVTDGRIKRLLINIPPGTMKSLIVSVFWPAWEWARGLSHLRYISTSYNETFVTRDTRRMRDLVLSEWYQLHWPLRMKRAGETSFENERGGFREGYMFRSLTGGRGNRVIIDDPHSTEGAESDADRQRAVRVFLESVPSRVNDQTRDAIVVVMQRLHERDVAGIILSKPELGYVHLCIPMRYEPAAAKARGPTSIGWEDPRTEEGELLFPIKFPEAETRALEASLGNFGTSGQLQQRPVPRGGGLFKREWFTDHVLKEVPNDVVAWTRAYDLAATEKKQGNDPSYTSGVRMGRRRNGRFVIAHAWRDRKTPKVIRDRIKLQAKLDPEGTRIHLPIDPGQAGVDQKDNMLLDLAGYDVKCKRPTGDKWTRAEPLAVQCEAGNVDVLEGPWLADFLDELCSFPKAAHDDQVDAAADAFNDLALGSRYSLDNV